MSNKSKRQPRQMPVIKLDLGCGRNCQAGFIGVDLYAPDAQIKHDLFKFPFPFKSESVDEIYASHFIEHIPQEKRWPFFEECWRILKPEGKMSIIVPNWKSERAYGDMTHQFPPVTAMFFYYLHKGWREANKLTYGPYDIKANFEHAAGPSGISAAFSQRAHEVQQYHCTHTLESYQDMWCTLTKKPL